MSIPPPTLSESPFARFVDPSDLAYEIAAEIEHSLKLTNLNLRAMATAIDNVLTPHVKRHSEMENAFNLSARLLQTLGCSEQDMKRLYEVVFPEEVKS